MRIITLAGRVILAAGNAMLGVACVMLIAMTIMGPVADLAKSVFAQPIAFNQITAGTNTLSTSAEVIATTPTGIIIEVLIQNDPDNTVDILVGDADSQTIQLEPGQSIAMHVDAIEDVYVVAASGTPTANYIVRR